MQSNVLCFEFCLLKTHKRATRLLRRSAQQYAKIAMTTSKITDSSQASLPTQIIFRGRGGEIVVGKVVKANIGELE